MADSLIVTKCKKFESERRLFFLVISFFFLELVHDGK